MGYIYIEAKALILSRGFVSAVALAAVYILLANKGSLKLGKQRKLVLYK